jgi:hypothetical protein
MVNRYTGLLPRSQVSAPARRARLLDCLASPRLLASLRGATRPRLSLGCCLCLSLSTAHVVSTWIADGVGGAAGAAVAISLELGLSDTTTSYHHHATPHPRGGGGGGRGRGRPRPGSRQARNNGVKKPRPPYMRDARWCAVHSAQQPAASAVCSVQSAAIGQPAARATGPGVCS